VQNGKLGSLCVSAVMLAALLTGVYSTMVEPTLTNVVTATRTETGSRASPIYTEVTSIYVSTSTESTIAGTVTTRLTVCSWACHSGYDFFSEFTLYVYESEYEGGYMTGWTETLRNVCILWGRETPAILPPESKPVEDYYGAVLSCGYARSTICSYSTRTLTVTSVNTNLSTYYSLVPFSVTLTEAYSKTVVNPQKLNLQRLAVVLFVIGFAGIALVIVLRAVTDQSRGLGGC
jgi:hypothetical protein